MEQIAKIPITDWLECVTMCVMVLHGLYSSNYNGDMFYLVYLSDLRSA